MERVMRYARRDWFLALGCILLGLAPISYFAIPPWTPPLRGVPVADVEEARGVIWVLAEGMLFRVEEREVWPEVSASACWEMRQVHGDLWLFGENGALHVGTAGEHWRVLEGQRIYDIEEVGGEAWIASGSGVYRWDGLRTIPVLEGQQAYDVEEIAEDVAGLIEDETGYMDDDQYKHILNIIKGEDIK